MIHRPRVVRAALVADDAFRLLDTHENEFAGTQWMPQNFFQRKRIRHILTQVEALYDDIAAVDLSGLPGHSIMERTRYRMWLDLRQAKRWQVKDHMKFFDHINEVLRGARNIFERLRRLAVTGQIVRTDPSEDTHTSPTLLD